MPAVAMFVLLALAQQAPCQQGQVVEVKHGRDYTLNVCGVGVIALRGVEPPLKVATGSFNFGPPERPNRIPTSGEVLGQKDIGPEAIAFLTRLLAGHRVTLVNDGYRMGDPGGRQYAYAFLPDKTHVNAELIRRGYAYADLQGSHPRRDEFVALEEVARRSKVGLWAPNP